MPSSALASANKRKSSGSAIAGEFATCRAKRRFTCQVKTSRAHRARQPDDREQRIGGEGMSWLRGSAGRIFGTGMPARKQKGFGDRNRQRGGRRRRKLKQAQGAFGQDGQNQAQKHQQPKRVPPARIEPGTQDSSGSKGRTSASTEACHDAAKSQPKRVSKLWRKRGIMA